MAVFRFMMKFQIFITMVLFIGMGVEANPMERCMRMMKFEEEFDAIVKLESEEQFNVFCTNMTAFLNCMDDVLVEQTGFKLKTLASMLQGTDMGNALTLVSNMVELVEDICTDGSELHEDYMANAECFRNINNDIPKECEKQAKDAYEAFAGDQSNVIPTRQEQVDQSCMTAAYQLGCLGAAIHEECGDDGFDVYKKIVKKVGIFKSGVCSANIMDTIKNGFADSLDISEPHRSLYRVIFELRKRRK